MSIRKQTLREILTRIEGESIMMGSSSESDDQKNVRALIIASLIQSIIQADLGGEEKTIYDRLKVLKRNKHLPSDVEQAIEDALTNIQSRR